MGLARTEWPRHLIFNPFIGCAAGGTSTGCKNCTALRTAKRNAYSWLHGSPRHGGFGHEACAKALTNLSGVGAEKVAWNGKIIYNPQAIKELEKMKSPREILVGMSGDVGYADPEQLQELMTMLTKSKKFNHHFFTMVTKKPAALLRAIRGIRFPHNLGVNVSVEDGKFMHRVETLRRFPNTVLKGAWLKPFVGKFEPETDFSGMMDVVAAGEIAPGPRRIDMDSLLHCARAARRAGASFVYEGDESNSWSKSRERRRQKELEDRLRRAKAKLKGQRTN